jgi:hypothetical protein
LVAGAYEAGEGKGSPDVICALGWTATDEGQAADAMTDLSQWVDRILIEELGGHGMAAIMKACWANHREAVWKLGNLMQEWCRIYNPAIPNLGDALTFFDRWLPGVQIRLQNTMTQCGPRTGCTTGKAVERWSTLTAWPARKIREIIRAWQITRQGSQKSCLS